MDILSLVQNDSAEVEIRHPATGKPCGITIKLWSRHSPNVKEIGRKIADKRIQSVRKGKHIDASLIEEESLDLIVASVKGWDGVEKDGEELPCTAENVRMVLSIPGMEWIKQQIDEAIGNEALFFRG